jgi:hypothetical protein
MKFWFLAPADGRHKSQVAIFWAITTVFTIGIFHLESAICAVLR